MNRTRKLIVACAFAMAVPGIAACGGDDGGDEDPEALLREALGQDVEYDSGVVNIGLDGSLEGVTSGSLEADIGGPFQSGSQGEPPELALDAEASVNAEGLPGLPGGSVSFDFSGGFGLADDTLFLSYQDTTYEASPKLYSQIRPLLESVESAGETTQDPESADAFINALTNLENEGTEDVEGESTTHVSGDFDIAALAEESSETAGVPLDVSQLEGFSSTVDLYVAEEDKSFRRLDLGFSADEVEALAQSGIEGLSFTISVGISDVNSPQTIEAPTDTQPLDELLQQFGISESQILKALKGGLVPPALGTLPGAGGGAGGGATPGAIADPAVQECLREVDPTDPDAIAKCLE